MPGTEMISQATEILHYLCLEIPNRRVGSPGNRAATDFLAGRLRAAGWQVTTPEFACMDWSAGEVSMTVAGQAFPVQASPYSLGVQVQAPLVAAATRYELDALDFTGKLLLMHGELVQEQIMPKNFVFYNPADHQQLVALLETRAPAAIIAATGRNPELAGGKYPFPLFEDGDFDIPSVYMKDVDGDLLAQHAGEIVSLYSETRRIPAIGCNVSAKLGPAGAQRVVVCAHIDSKIDTPGALDNAAGTTVLLLLGELLSGYTGQLGIEILALNGEDYYSAPGQMLFYQENEGHFAEIDLAINLDAVGFRQTPSAYSLYNVPEPVTAVVERLFANFPDLQAGEPWYQGDHSIFIQKGRPAIALTSANLWELSTYITHTPQDHPELVDPARLVQIAHALRELLLELGHQSSGRQV